MKKFIHVRRAALPALLLWLLVGAGTELSASQRLIASPPIPVTIREVGQATRPEIYTVYLEAGKETMPMPIGSQGGLYRMEFAGAGTKSIPPMDFEEVGIYPYRIYQEREAHDGCLCDERVYDLTLCVTREATAGMELRLSAVLHCGDGDEKLSEILFENILPPAQMPDPPTTGDASCVVPPAALLLLSLAALALVLRRKRGG